MSSPHEGSVWLNYIPSGVSGVSEPETSMSSGFGSGVIPQIPESMWLSGWRPRDHSKHTKTIWQVERHHLNGSWDEIRFDAHKGEKPHYLTKRMLTLEEKPTRKQFFEEIAPRLARVLNSLVKKTKRPRKSR